VLIIYEIISLYFICFRYSIFCTNCRWWWYTFIFLSNVSSIHLFYCDPWQHPWQRDINYFEEDINLISSSSISKPFERDMEQGIRTYLYYL